MSNKNEYTQVKDLNMGGSSHIVKVQNMVNQEFYASKIMAVKKEKVRKVEQIRQEIRFLSELKHNNIVKFIESNENEPFDNILEFRIILGLAEGDLGELLANQKERKEYLSEERILQLMKGIFKGVEYCHERNIIHNDLKPKNILIKEGIPKLSDFGSATELENSKNYILIPNKEGTKGYMAPEIWEDDRYSYKSDVWALGCIFYELCTFRLPYFPQYSTNNMCDNSSILAQYSPQLRAIVDEMLKIDYMERPSLNHLNKRINYLTKLAIGKILTIKSFPQYKDTEEIKQILHGNLLRYSLDYLVEEIQVDETAERSIIDKSKTSWKIHPYYCGGISFFIFLLFIAIALLSYYLHNANNEIYKLEDKIKENENKHEDYLSKVNIKTRRVIISFEQNQELRRKIHIFQNRLYLLYN